MGDNEGCYLIVIKGTYIWFPLVLCHMSSFLFQLHLASCINFMLSLTNVVHLWSLQVFPKVQLIDDEFKAFTKCTQDGGTKVVQVKVDKGFITLSMA